MSESFGDPFPLHHLTKFIHQLLFSPSAHSFIHRKTCSYPRSRERIDDASVHGAAVFTHTQSAGLSNFISPTLVNKTLARSVARSLSQPTKIFYVSGVAERAAATRIERQPLGDDLPEK
ncbi:hypothetical protein EVAR_19579_1 [Eumeta japonica]|uniref:Uncharacterized protein n=1 Tax=Eumeta variegata TaxID=151549 RepID=A0A4C1UFI9_EUMVA|nr:hypothetical protein EVAR_19579_1 [Eumeta japonica]